MPSQPKEKSSEPALSKITSITGATSNVFSLTKGQTIIPPDMTFRQWCEKLGREGLKVDGSPFTLEDRPAMAFIYDLIPSTREEAFRKVTVMMKCAQVGFTVMEMLATIYLGIKFGPATVGMFLPDQALAGIKSTQRFMPILRTVPTVYRLIADEQTGEGNVRTRRIGDSLYVFSWTSGKATTESIPMDVLSFDEVQEISKSQIEKTMERLSASDVRYTLMGSTANWPDDDIHHFYKMGKRYTFHTECPTCGAKKPLDDYFPDCIKYDPEKTDELTGRPGDYRYVCEHGHWIDDPQRGEWIAEDPSAWIDSVHFPQMLSPTISPGEIIQKYRDSTDKKNFHNRVLGKPWLDPTQVPVTLEHMARCVAAGKDAGVQWKKSARGAFMGIDQMGNYNVIVLKERLPDGRQAVIHLEEIYSDDPFARCDELMKQYGVSAAVVEINPNYNDAKRFANRHPGRVFICNSFGELAEDMMRWGDGPKLDVSDRRTDEEERDRYTVRIDQWKCMQTSMARFTAREPICLFPDPQELVQDVVDKGIKERAAVAPRAFLHFTRTALVVEKVKAAGEKEASTNHYRRVVRKIGLDPHFSYANLLCDVAWARAHGTSTFILPTGPGTSAAPPKSAQAKLAAMPGLSPAIVALAETLPPGEVCGKCQNFDAGNGMCIERMLLTAPRDPRCELFVPVDE